jgi:peroxiredoxin
VRPFLIALLLAAALPAAAAEIKPWTGGVTPALDLPDMKGKQHRLADYKGKVVLVNFWATWCEPCRDEMPSIERLRASLAGQPFEVLAVNLAEPRSRIERFLEKMPLSFPLLLDRDSSVAKGWKARILPATYIVGRDGRIRYVHFGDRDWADDEARKKISALFEK